MDNYENIILICVKLTINYQNYCHSLYYIIILLIQFNLIQNLVHHILYFILIYGV